MYMFYVYYDSFNMINGIVFNLFFCCCEKRIFSFDAHKIVYKLHKHRCVCQYLQGFLQQIYSTRFKILHLDNSIVSNLINNFSRHEAY